MKKIITALLLLFSISAFAGEDSVDTSGDVLRALLPALAYGATFYKDDAEGRMQFYKSFALNAVATYGLKETVKKERPDGSGDDAFPSGHASMSFQAAAFLQKRYGYVYGVPAYAAAAYTGWTRIYSDEHTESDVLAGAVIGVGSALLFTREFEKVTVTPIAGKNFYGANVSVKW
ncbi:MAG: PAP2 family protein [Denitrovibrio sp.]|nr:MAG: PAP2 family protein [Denitrovibrio sp.]